MPSAAGVDFQSSTGIGGFNVRYDPDASELVCTLKVGIDFRDALTVDTTTGVVTPTTTGFAPRRGRHGPATPVPRRGGRRTRAEVQTDWQWSAQQRTDWRGDYESTAEGMWGGQHHFTADRWDDVYADVRVDMNVHAGHLAGDHCRATVFKDPPGNRSGPGAVVNSTTGNATASTGTFRTSDLQGTNDYLNYSLQFESGSANLHRDVLDQPRGVRRRRRRPPGQAHRRLPARHADGRRAHHGHRPRQRDRATARTTCGSRGARRGRRQLPAHARRPDRLGADHGRGRRRRGRRRRETWQRVDIRIGDGRAQVTMAHETGHMFGLDDEYASPPGGISPGAGTPGQIGTPVAHGPLSGAMGGGVQTAVFENNDNIMSVGNVVRPQHYATFLEGLNLVTTPERFHYGGAGHSPTAIPDLIGPDVVQPPDATPTAVA